MHCMILPFRHCGVRHRPPFSHSHSSYSHTHTTHTHTYNMRLYRDACSVESYRSCYGIESLFVHYIFVVVVLHWLGSFYSSRRSGRMDDNTVIRFSQAHCCSATEEEKKKIVYEEAWIGTTPVLMLVEWRRNFVLMPVLVRSIDLTSIFSLLILAIWCVFK